MALGLPLPNKAVGDAGHVTDTNAIINAINTLDSKVNAIPAGPKGDKGDPGTPGSPGVAATITVASVATGVPGSSAVIVEQGTPQNRQLMFVIPRGDKGEPGVNGIGIPPGGTTGQALGKASNSNFDVGWVTPVVSVTSVNGRVGVVTLNDLFDALGAATTAQAAAQTYVDANYIPNTLKGANSGIATLDATGKIITTQLPALAITETTVVASEAAMLALTAQVGDVAVRSDESKSYILTASPASTLANWQVLLSPPNAVLSVDGRTGAVTLSDLYAAKTHAATHAAGGADQLTLTEAQVTGLVTDLAAKAPLASPTFTGTLTFPTAAGFLKSSAGGVVSSAAIAEADVTGLVADLAAKAPVASPTFTGTVTTPLTTAGIVKTSAAGVLSSVAALAESDITNLVTDLAAKMDKSVTINTQIASYTAVLTDAANVVEMNVATGNTFTVPPNSSVAFPVGTQIDVVQYGAGQVTITPGAGVTIRSAGSLTKTRVQYSAVTLYKRATDEWVLNGDLA